MYCIMGCDEFHSRFGETYCIHLQNRRVNEVSKQGELPRQLTIRQQHYILPLRRRSLLCYTQVAPVIIRVSTGVRNVSPAQKPLQII
jgi:hypothetical protein